LVSFGGDLQEEFDGVAKGKQRQPGERAALSFLLQSLWCRYLTIARRRMVGVGRGKFILRIADAARITLSASPACSID
jgi:hypothetical protein